MPKIISSLKDTTTVRESREDRRKRRQMEKKVTKTLDQICKDMTNNFFVDDAEGAANRLAEMSASTSEENYSKSVYKRKVAPT